MKRRFWMGMAVLGMWLLGATAGCGEPVADVKQTQRYAQKGIEFSYPGNWTISDDSQTGAVHQVYVDSPGNAICIVQVQPTDGAMPVDEYAHFFSKTFTKEVPVGKVHHVSFGDMATQSAVKKITEKFVLELAGVQMPHTRSFHQMEIGGRTATLIYQVADEDAAPVQPGFALIQRSFKLKDAK